MELKIKIKTAKGSAKITSERIKALIIGGKKVKHDIYVNKADNMIVWNVEGSVRDCLSINRNVNMFDKTMKGILNSKVVRMAARKDFDDKQMKEFNDLIKNETSVEIVKKATAEELVEANKTWWQKIKETFVKQD